MRTFFYVWKRGNAALPTQFLASCELDDVGENADVVVFKKVVAQEADAHAIGDGDIDIADDCALDADGFDAALAEFDGAAIGNFGLEGAVGFDLEGVGHGLGDEGGASAGIDDHVEGAVAVEGDLDDGGASIAAFDGGADDAGRGCGAGGAGASTRFAAELVEADALAVAIDHVAGTLGCGWGDG